MILRFTYLLFFCIIHLSACAQPLDSDKYIPIRDTLNYSLGSTPIRVTLRTFKSPSPLFFVHLHDNETTAEETAISILEQYGGQLLSIDNNKLRNINFLLGNQFFTIDPNRIFSDTGIIATLKLLSQPDSAAFKATKGFAQFILSHIPDSVLVVAVHNNTDERFSVKSYDTLPLKNEAAAVTINSHHDIDDFILTTDISLYNFYKNENINAILQREDLLTDDGSLSIFFGKKKRPYINVEAEHGHGLQQILLIEKLYTFLELEKKNLAEKQ